MSNQILIPLIIFGVICIVGIILAILISLGVILPFVGVGLWFRNDAKKVEAIKREAQTWQTVRGKIVTSRVEVSGTEYTTVSPRIVYTYTVNGIEYQSRQVRIGDQILTLYAGREPYDLVDRYPVGAEVEVYYNPEKPEQASLER